MKLLVLFLFSLVASANVYTGRYFGQTKLGVGCYVDMAVNQNGVAQKLIFYYGGFQRKAFALLPTPSNQKGTLYTGTFFENGRLIADTSFMDIPGSNVIPEFRYADAELGQVVCYNMTKITNPQR